MNLGCQVAEMGCQIARKVLRKRLKFGQKLPILDFGLLINGLMMRT
jgi:hypothetical protein